MTSKSLGYNLTEDLIYLSEFIKGDGYLSLKHRECSIQNKNIQLINRLNSILESNNVKVSRRILIKIKPEEQKICKSDIFVKFKSKMIAPRIEQSPFDSSKKIVFNLPYQEKFKFVLNLFEKKYNFSGAFGKHDIEITGKYPSFGYIEIRFSKIKFLRFLDKYIKQYKKYLTNNKFIISAFAALVDAEGTLDYYGHKRGIRVRIKDHGYLNSWSKFLRQIRVNSHLSYEKNRNLWCLTIYGWQNFNILDRTGLSLYHSKKMKKFSIILNSYIKKQVSRNSAINFYLDKLKEIKHPISAKDLSIKLGKSKRVVNHQLLRLEKLGLIKVNKSKRNYTYSVF